MTIKIPSSTPRKLIFPYLEISNGYAYSHHNPRLKSYGLPTDLLDKFFVSLHKATVLDFHKINYGQKLFAFTFPFFALTLICFAILIGIFYQENQHSLIVEISAGLILGLSALFMLWITFIELKLAKMTKILNSKIRQVIVQTNEEIGDNQALMMLPDNDFPYWIELWLENTPQQVQGEEQQPASASVEPTTAYLSPNTIVSSGRVFLGAKYLAPPEVGSPKLEDFDPSNRDSLASEQIKLVVK